MNIMRVSIIIGLVVGLYIEKMVLMVLSSFEILLMLEGGRMSRIVVIGRR